jgi:exoribonuclease R
MSVKGIVELHGGKLVVQHGDALITIQSDKFMHGDKVTVNQNGDIILLERREQAGIGVIKSIENGTAKLYMANLGPSCPFSPEIQLQDKQIQIGDRLVVWFSANGEVGFRGLYTSNPLDDVPCLLKMYSLYKKPDDFTYLINDWGNPLYTIDKVINEDHLNTFTIDPATSEDFDDAISVDIANSTVYIHIVDIATADCDSQISETARKRLKERCLTLYLANEHTEHLLDPEVASDTLSLIKGKQRNVITMRVVLNDNGIVNNYDIYKSTIVVKQRWNYDEVSDMLKTRQTNQDLQFLLNLTKMRSSNIAYNINLPSVRFHIDKSTGLIDNLKIESTNDDSHNIVATVMILGNLVVSKHLKYCQVVLPNRFHETLHGMSNVTYTPTGNTFVDSFILVKRYARACYSVDKKGHFGLGLTDYVHFTSPMRRYADVIVHRILSGAILNDEALEKEVEWLNFRASAVKSIQDLYTNWKLVRHIQTEAFMFSITNNRERPYEIWITDVKKGGVLWFMPSMSLNGFAHVSTLSPKQFWYFDYTKNTLEGQSNKAIISIGKPFYATVTSVDPITYVLNLTIYSQ